MAGDMVGWQGTWLEGLAGGGHGWMMGYVGWMVGDVAGGRRRSRWQEM
jgi:hypothetical protein